MSCCLFSAKPLPEPMLVYCQLDSWEQISVKCNIVPHWLCACSKWSLLKFKLYSYFGVCIKGTVNPDSLYTKISFVIIRVRPQLTWLYSMVENICIDVNSQTRLVTTKLSITWYWKNTLMTNVELGSVWVWTLKREQMPGLHMWDVFYEYFEWNGLCCKESTLYLDLCMAFCYQINS